MSTSSFPTIDIPATGQNIRLLLKEKNVSIKTVQQWLGFSDVRAIYSWQEGHALPSIDNLYALSRFLGVTIDEILVGDEHYT